jgi:hypothetical protein
MVGKMKRPTIFFAILLFASVSFSQGMGQHRQFWDPNSIVSISGTVTSVDSQASPRGNNFMIRLIVKDTSNGSSTVVVGPSSYLDKEGITFSKGEKIKVTGSKVRFGDTEFVLAAQIDANGKEIKLRDGIGRPLWFRGGFR